MFYILLLKLTFVCIFSEYFCALPGNFEILFKKIYVVENVKLGPLNFGFTHFVEILCKCHFFLKDKSQVSNKQKTLLVSCKNWDFYNCLITKGQYWKLGINVYIVLHFAGG